MIQIAIVGEAWGEREELQRSPFVGPAGYELTRMLDEAGIRRSDCYLTNVFNLRPRPTNDVENLCQETKVGTLPPLTKGKYLKPMYYSELDRLIAELDRLRPNITILCGNTACWALLGNAGISKIRGTVVASSPIIGNGKFSGRKCLPTYHPSYILRPPFGWFDRPVTVLDFRKAKRESAFPEIRRPERTIYIEPALQDLEWFYHEHLLHADLIAFDIETASGQITCIGFSPNASVCLVVPFTDARQAGCSYWESPTQELWAWQFVKRVLALPCKKLAQNGLYDIHYLWRTVGITVRNAAEDTMLLHHALQPESEKSLGFLGSVYTNEASWKLMRKGTTLKRDK